MRVENKTREFLKGIRAGFRFSGSIKFTPGRERGGLLRLPRFFPFGFGRFDVLQFELTVLIGAVHESVNAGLGKAAVVPAEGPGGQCAAGVAAGDMTAAGMAAGHVTAASVAARHVGAGLVRVWQLPRFPLGVRTLRVAALSVAVDAV